MKGKKIYWIVGILIVLGVAFYVYKSKSRSADNGEWEKEVQRNMAWMKVDANTMKLLTDKAKEKGKTFDQVLREDAEWYADKKYSRPA